MVTAKHFTVQVPGQIMKILPIAKLLNVQEFPSIMFAKSFCLSNLSPSFISRNNEQKTVSEKQSDYKRYLCYFLDLSIYKVN